MFTAKVQRFGRIASVGTMVAALVAAMLARPALAQVEDTDPYYVKVSADMTALRCGPETIWYSIADLQSGQVLMVDGKSNGWLRVSYPPGTYCVVKEGDGQLSQSDGAVILARRSRLRAFNMKDPVWEGCWKAAFQDALKPGMELRYIGPMNNRTGELSGYIVEAPDEARGYVLERDTTGASEEEVRAYLDKVQSRRALASAQTPRTSEPLSKPQTTAQNPQTTPQETETKTAQQPPAREPVNQQPESGTEQVASSPNANQPQTITPQDQPTSREPASQPTQVAQTPTETQPTSSDVPVEQPIATDSQTTEEVAEASDDASEPETAAPVKERPILSLKELDSAFERVMKGNVKEAEYEPLIEEYSRYGETLGDGPIAEREKRYIETKMELLAIRAELQQQEQALEAIQQSASSAAETEVKTIERLVAGREFDIVGRLMVSTIYDGERLPRLYRLQSVSAGGGRTMAYVVPTEGLSMDTALGAIVGIRGDVSSSDTSGVPVVKPVNVQVLKPAERGQAE